jgi:hypothetical protein
METFFNHGAVVTVGPEGAAAMFAPVVSLGKFVLQLLHRLADGCAGFRAHQRMAVIGVHAISKTERGLLRTALQSNWRWRFR